MGCNDCGPGSRNVKIKVQDNPRPDDGYGGQDNAGAAWVDKYETWSSMRKANGRELFAHRHRETRSIYVFELDFPLSVEVLTTDRILFGTRAFDIFDVDNLGERNWKLKIMAEEGRSD